MSMRNSSDTIGNRNRDFPAHSAVSQPPAPPRTPYGSVRDFKFQWGRKNFTSPCFTNTDKHDWSRQFIQTAVCVKLAWIFFHRRDGLIVGKGMTADGPQLSPSEAEIFLKTERPLLMGLMGLRSGTSDWCKWSSWTCSQCFEYCQSHVRTWREFDIHQSEIPDSLDCTNSNAVTQYF